MSYIRPKSTDVERVAKGALYSGIQSGHSDSGQMNKLTTNKVSRGPRTKVGQMMMRKMFGGFDRTLTIVNPSADETGESEGAVEDTVGGVGQSDILKASGSQVGRGREHADGGKAKGRRKMSEDGISTRNG